MAVTSLDGLPDELLKDFDENDESLTAAGRPLYEEGDRAVERVKKQFLAGRKVYDAKTQPRDNDGKFRQILARLKFELGDSELESITNEIRQAQAHLDTGDIAEATKAGKNVVQLIDSIENGILNPNVAANVRTGARELGRVMAYLPVPQGEQTEKVRFSDLPAAVRTLIKSMVTKVEAKAASGETAEATAKLRSFMSGGLTMSSDDMLSEFNVLLRILT